MNDFRGRLILVTGAGSGIGRATALRFAREGARLLLADIDGSWCEQTAALAARMGATATAKVVDVSDGIAQVRFTGACASCPSTIMTLIMGVEQELRARVPEVQFLEAVP